MSSSTNVGLRPSSNSELGSASNSSTVNQIHCHFRSNFSSFADEPWTLSSGTVVDDVLWKYALSLLTETPIHSFVIDCGNPNVEALFKDKDWNEIVTLDRKVRPFLPDWILRQLFAYSKQNSTA
jgi:hypothetical protein